MHDSTRDDERGISEILGTIMLISLVLLSSAVIVVWGSQAISQATDRTHAQAAEDYLEQLDSEFATLAAGSDDPEVSFNPQDSPATNFQARYDGEFEVTVNGNPACSVTQQLSSITYEDSLGNVIGYEAGGVWRGGPNGSSQVTAPDVSFTDRTLDIRLVNFTGHVDQAENTMTLNVSETTNRTETVTSTLLQGDKDCARPDDITIRVQSRFYQGWGDYLESETGETANLIHADNAAEVTIPQAKLHRSADDTRNKVVNLTDHRVSPPADIVPYMDPIISEGKPPELGVNKSVPSNDYTTYIGPLTNQSLRIGNTIDVNGSDVLGPPLDVTLVLDESGSMAYDEDGNGITPGQPHEPNTCLDEPNTTCESRLELARDAAQDFVGYLNSSRDRVSLVGFNDSHATWDPDQANYHLIDGQYLSQDFSGMNDTLDDDTHAYHGTSIHAGMDYANSVFDLQGNESRRNIMIVLTDGRNSGCDDGDDDPYDCGPNIDTRRQAWIADNSSTTVFTIGFGSDSEINDELLRDVANATDGKYYPARNSTALSNAFRDIRRSIRPVGAIAYTPITSNVASAGTVYKPQIPGNTSHIATTSGSGLRNITNTSGSGLRNINDPTAPALFSHAFPLQDGQTFDLNVTGYDCADGHYNLTGSSVGGRAVARCSKLESVNESYTGYVYVDGERPDRLLDPPRQPWEQSVNDMVDAFPTVDIDPGTQHLNTTSNQALVVFDLPPTGPSEPNILPMLVRIGLAESDAQGTGIVTMRVAEAKLE